MLKNSDENDYDSMIENGTSEEDSDMADQDEDSASDGFSDREEEEEDEAESPTPEAGKFVKRPQDESLANKEPPSKKAKSGPNEKVKPPTLEEMNELKETRNLFHSNLFRLQVKEMLNELKVKEKYTNYINKWLEQFKGFLGNIENSAKEDVDKMSWLQESPLNIPLDLQQLRVQQFKLFQFNFEKPTQEPYLIGAAATHTLLGPKLTADVCVPMPASCFDKDNYLNLVYDQKRAYYLTYIAIEMLKSTEFEGLKAEHLKFSYYSNDPLKPILEIQPATAATSIANKLSIRLFVAGEEQSFKLQRFVPWNSNLRSCLFGDDDDEDAENTNAVPLATPNYNARVLFDLTMHRNQQLLNETFESHKNFQEGLVLLKVWLRQRDLHVGFSGFRPHTLAMFIAYLFKQRKLHANMSSYQVARNVWNQLAHSTWDEDGKGITLSTETANSKQPTLEQFHTYYDVVFVDTSGYYNICANLSLEMYRRVRMEAKQAVDMLNDMHLNSFQLIFMTKCPLYSQFDHILKIYKEDIVEQILEMYVKPADKLNFAGYSYPQLLKVVTGLLRKGLGKRVFTLLPVEQAIRSWSCLEAPNTCANYLQLGIVLDPAHAYEVLDKGPESIDAEAAEEFRKFWGEKAQLRRFQDGSITESVVWAQANDTLMKKRLIVRSIVLHLLQKHFQVEPTEVEYIAGEFDVVYQLTNAYKTDSLWTPVAQDTDAEAMSLQVIRTFDDLSRKLHALNELPLEIVSIAGISPVFRYCDPIPILPLARMSNEQYFAPRTLRAVIQLGLSGKWPGDLTALRALKLAFYIQIAQLLRAKYRGMRSRVTNDGVLVMHRGYCFVFELAHSKEVALMKREKTERGITQYVDCPASIELEKRHYVLPKLSGALHALYQLQPCFGSTTMIAKRWLYSQLIDDGVWPDECTELLVASLFVNTHAKQVSCSPQTGFIRFLQLLAYTDWNTELVFINFNQSMDENELSSLEQRFHSARDTFPPLCIATAYDQKQCGHLWSSTEKPNVHILARVIILARQALSLIETSLLNASPIIRPTRIFRAPQEGYDLVIQLKPDMVTNTFAWDFGSPFAAFTRPNWRLPLADTNAVQSAVQKLREGYSNFAAFFYNPSGGKEIAIVWKPAEVFAPKPFKVTDVNGCSLTDDNQMVQCRKETLIEDFKFILKDFYLRVGTVEDVRQASQRDSSDSKKAASKVKIQQGRYFKQEEASTEPKANGKTKKSKDLLEPANKPAENKKLKVKMSKVIKHKKPMPKDVVKKKKTKA